MNTEKTMKDAVMTKEMLDKAKAATSAEELIGIAKGYGVELQQHEAQALFVKLQKRVSGELSEEELDDVAGGIWLFWRK